MQIESGYQTALSDFGFCKKKMKIGEKIIFKYFCFAKNSTQNEFSKKKLLQIFERPRFDEYVCKISSWYFEILLSFAILDVKECHFSWYSGGFKYFTILDWLLWISRFCAILAIQKVF